MEDSLFKELSLIIDDDSIGNRMTELISRRQKIKKRQARVLPFCLPTHLNIDIKTKRLSSQIDKDHDSPVTRDENIQPVKEVADTIAKPDSMVNTVVSPKNVLGTAIQENQANRRATLESINSSESSLERQFRPNEVSTPYSTVRINGKGANAVLVEGSIKQRTGRENMSKGGHSANKGITIKSLMRRKLIERCKLNDSKKIMTSPKAIETPKSSIANISRVGGCPAIEVVGTDVVLNETNIPSKPPADVQVEVPHPEPATRCNLDDPITTPSQIDVKENSEVAGQSKCERTIQSSCAGDAPTVAPAKLVEEEEDKVWAALKNTPKTRSFCVKEKLKQSILLVPEVDANETVDTTPLQASETLERSMAPLNLVSVQSNFPSKESCHRLRNWKTRRRLQLDAIAGPPPAHPIIKCTQEKRKKIQQVPLNAAPNTPINGEKFAQEMKVHVARLKGHNILDLRRRGSMNSVDPISGRKSSSKGLDDGRLRVPQTVDVAVETYPTNAAVVVEEVMVANTEAISDAVANISQAIQRDDNKLHSYEDQQLIEELPSLEAPEAFRDACPPTSNTNDDDQQQQNSSISRNREPVVVTDRFTDETEADRVSFVKVRREQSNNGVRKPRRLTRKQTTQPALLEFKRVLNEARMKRSVTQCRRTLYSQIDDIDEDNNGAEKSGNCRISPALPVATPSNESVFKKPTKPAPRKKAKKANSLQVPLVSASVEEDTRTLRRSKRGQIPLRNYWSFRTTDPTPLSVIMLQQVEEKNRLLRERLKKTKKSPQKRKTDRKKAKLPEAEKELNVAATTSADLDKEKGKGKGKRNKKLDTKKMIADSTDVNGATNKEGNKERKNKEKEYSIKCLQHSQIALQTSQVHQIENIIESLVCGGTNEADQITPSQTEAPTIAPLLTHNTKQLRVRLKRFPLKTSQNPPASAPDQLGGAAETCNSDKNNVTGNDILSWLQSVDNTTAIAANMVLSCVDGIDFVYYEQQLDGPFGYLRFKPQQRKPSKRIRNYDVQLVVLSGKFRFATKFYHRDLNCGSIITLTIGTEYQIKNITDSPAVLMVIRAPDAE